MNRLTAKILGSAAEKVAKLNAKVEKPWIGSLPTPKELKK